MNDSITQLINHFNHFFIHLSICIFVICILVFMTLCTARKRLTDAVDGT